MTSLVPLAYLSIDHYLSIDVRGWAITRAEKRRHDTPGVWIHGRVALRLSCPQFPVAHINPLRRE